MHELHVVFSFQYSGSGSSFLHVSFVLCWLVIASPCTDGFGRMLNVLALSRTEISDTSRPRCSEALVRFPIGVLISSAPLSRQSPGASAGQLG